jgi:hypothetical protein
VQIVIAPPAGFIGATSRSRELARATRPGNALPKTNSSPMPYVLLSNLLLLHVQFVAHGVFDVVVNDEVKHPFNLLNPLAT